jgi:hypothetical protein
LAQFINGVTLLFGMRALMAAEKINGCLILYNVL